MGRDTACTDLNIYGAALEVVPSWRAEQIGPSTYEIRRGARGDGTSPVRAVFDSRLKGLAWFFEQVAGGRLMHIDPEE